MDSTLEFRRHHIQVKDDTPIADTDTFCQIPQASSSIPPPINETTPVNSVDKISTESSTESNDPRFYAREDDLANTEVDVEFVHSFRHEAKSVFSLCFSCDGGYLALAMANSGGGSIIMYEVESRAKYCELKEYASQYGSCKRSNIESLSFSANGRCLAAGDDDNRVIIWDIPNRRIRSIFQGQGNNYAVLARFSPDGSLVAFRENNMKLLVLGVRDKSRKIASECSSFDFSPNGRHIATGNRNGDLAILDVRTGKEVKRWNGHGTLVFRVIFASNGKRLLSGYNGVLEHWDLDEAEPILIWKSDIKTILHDISPDNRLLACSNELRVVDSGKRQCILKGHIAFIHSVYFSAAGIYLAMADWTGLVSLWKYTRT